jgi:hypothetical protein
VLLAFDPADGTVMPAAGEGGEAVVTGAGAAGDPAAGVPAAGVPAAARTGGLGM